VKQFYFWIFFISFVGLFIAYKLRPVPEKVAQLELKGGLYLKAAAYYKGEYQRGNHSPKILVPLLRIDMQLGEIDEAIEMTRELATIYPENIFLLRQLADLYLANQQYDNYFQALRELQKIHVTPDLLQELSTWYLNTNESKKRLEVLTPLCKTALADAGDVQQQALLLAQQKKYQEAVAALEELQRLFPKKVRLDDVLLEVWLLVQMDQPAVSPLANYLLKKRDLQEASQSLEIFKEEYPDLLYPLIVQLKTWIEQDPLLKTQELAILWDQGLDKESVYRKTKKLYTDHPHSPNLQALWVRILLERQDLCALLEGEWTNLEESSLFPLILFSINQNRPDLVKPFVGKRPPIIAALSVAKKESRAHSTLADLAQTFLPSADRFYLFQVAVAAHYNNLALKFGEQLFPYIGLHDYQFNQLAHLYLSIGEGEEYETMLQEAEPIIGTQNQATAIALLDIAAHRSEKVASWLQGDPKIKKGMLDDLYSRAEEAKEYPLALYIAKRRMAQWPAVETEADYALTLVQVGKYTSGLALLQRIYSTNSKNRTVESDYFSALLFATKQDKGYREELKEFIESRIRRGSICPEQLREYGHAELNVLHNFDLAETIFRSLAQRASPESSDVQTLVELFGPKASPEQIAWIQERALGSCWTDFGIWIHNLSHLGEYETVIELFERRKEEGFVAKSYFAYLDAQLSEKKLTEARLTIDEMLCQIQDQEDLKLLSIYAEQASYLSARREIWERLVAQNPEESRFWQELGRAAFDAHDDTCALRALDQFFALSCDSLCDARLAESFYEYGEILRKRRHPWRADTFFYKALNCLDQLERKSLRTQVLEATVVYKLSLHNRDPLVLMRRAYTNSLHNPEIAADYANMLMDMGQLNNAEQVLGGFR